MFNIKTYLKNTVEAFLAWFSITVKQTTSAYCELETADDTYTFATHDGSLVSIIRVEGSTELLGEREGNLLHARLSQSLQGLMAPPGRTIQIVFHYDPTTTQKYLEKLVSGSRSTIQTLKLDLDDLLAARIQKISEYCHEEHTYITLWTHPNHLNHTQRKQSDQEKLEFIREHRFQQSLHTQNLIAANALLRNNHALFVKSIQEMLKTNAIKAISLDTHASAHLIRQLADPEFTGDNWRACLPGDPIPLKHHHPPAQPQDILWPTLSRQLLPRDAEALDLRTIRWGDRIYSCVFVDLLPQQLQDFNNLLKQTITTHVPWRLAFLGTSGSLNRANFKEFLATVLSFSSEENRLLSDAHQLLRDLAATSDESIVQLKILACTWAPAEQVSLLRQRAATLARVIQNWGMIDLSEISGDTFEGLVATLPGLTSQSIATPTLLPTSELVKMLPLKRPASPWSTGTQLFRTTYGKIWPFEPGSSLQTAWVDLIYAKPGSGKSVLSNALNLAVCLKSGLEELPYISVLDIGPSSQGFISLIQEALPSEQRHQAAYYALEMSSKYAINPFDTQLGSRTPSAQEREYLVNLLTLLATPLENTHTYDGITEMAGLVVDEAYKRLSDTQTPNLYVEGQVPTIDACLGNLMIDLDTPTSWWDITDLLFERGHVQKARLAQRYAVPLLKDITAIVHHPTIRDLYQSMVTPSGEPLIEAFNRMISRAVREYPVFSNVTQIDLQSSRVIALDLNRLAKSDGPASTRQTAIMYMLARHLLVHNHFTTDTSLDTVPNNYKNYHRQRLQSNKLTPKRLVFDEFHRTGNIPIVRQQILSDMREGRKSSMQIALVSQSLDDFDGAMVEFATSVYILNAGHIQTIKKSASVFGLSETAQELLRHRVHGPDQTGMTFLGQFSTREGTYTQLLTLTLSTIELWALNTSPDDVFLREKCIRSLGSMESYRRLAKHFPTGSAQSFIESRLSREESSDLPQLKENIIDSIYQTLIK